MSAPCGPRMKLTLKPISHPRLGEIDIVDDLFPIGRNEEPFASRLGEEASSLSRRHARVFQENGKIFLADLGSLNGTRINERELKNDVAVLNDNDRITFGGAVEFRVEIPQTAAKPVAKASAIRLTLAPADPGSGLDSVVVESFPFLISRNEGSFEQYRERLPDAWRKLSRRHAVIALKGDRLSVEDLESSNGTYVSGERLDERARQLSDGDTIAFGDPKFLYKVRIQNLREPTQFAATIFGRSDQPPVPPAAPPQPAVVSQPSQPAAVEQPPPSVAPPSGGAHRTRFVSSADSFINVFCADDELAQNKSAEGAAKTLEVQQLQAPATGWGKFKHMFGQVWRALGGGVGVDRRFVWGGVAVLGVIVMAGAITYLIGIDRNEIKHLLDEGHYSESALAANRYLERNPDDLDVRAWAEDALIRSVVPKWTDYIEQGRFSDATQYLTAQREANRFNARGLQMIDTLAWAGRVQAHMADRGGPASPLVLFRHEKPIRELVEEWEANSFRRQQIMDQIVTREPKFEQVQAQLFSSLTSLRNDNSLYVKAMEDLKTAIQGALKRNQRQSIDKLLDEFAASYPRVGGVDVLRQDLARYDTLNKLVQQKELLQVVHMRRTSKFQSPIFAEHVDAWLASELPPRDIIDKHAEAAAAWRAGNHTQAIALLQTVKDAPWGEVATRQIARYQQIGADYDALMVSKGKDEYWDRLLVVWSSLRPDEDDYLIQSLQPDFLAHRDQVVPRLDQSLKRVRGYWGEYQSSGGIPGVIRVEERVSPRFSGQAKRLSGAYQEISSGARTYRLLQLTPPAEWQKLQQDVVDEVQRQRRWLEDLNIVLEPAVLHAKLALLPEISEQSLWVQSTSDPKKD